jgi:hypothetical protein
MIYFSDSVAQCNIWIQKKKFKYTVKIVFLWYTETVFSWYIQSLVPKCAFFISLSNGNTFGSFTIPKRKWYLWGSKSVLVKFQIGQIDIILVVK